MKTLLAWAMVDEEMSELPKVSGGGVVAGFVTAGHSVLFEDAESHRCDVCSAMLNEAPQEAGWHGGYTDSNEIARERQEDGFESGPHVTGRGLLVWTRGGERRYQEPPLCSGCAAAIGVSALQRWEIEEEEG